MDKYNHPYIFVYQTICEVNNKSYVGIHATSNLDDGYIGCGIMKPSDAFRVTYPFHRAVRKYGYASFKRHILSFYDTYEDAKEEERFIVNKDWVMNKNTYNVALGGHGGNLYGLSEERKKEIYKKISLANKGKKRSKEFCDRLSKSKQGVPLSDLHRKSLSDNNARYWKGKKRSEESILKLSLSCMGRKLSDETKNKISIAHRGKPSHQAMMIYKYSIDGTLLDFYKSIHEASDKNNIPKSTMHLWVHNNKIKNGVYFTHKKI